MEENLTPEERSRKYMEELDKLFPTTADQVEVPEEQPKWNPDLIPTVEKNISPEGIAIDEAIKSIGIIEAYDKFIGKERQEPGNRIDGIKVSCPTPDHRDSNPSAWVHVGNNLWTCGVCGVGGDIYDLGAIHFGYSWPDLYKKNGEFPNLKREIAEAFGFQVYTPLSGGQHAIAVDQDEPDVEEVAQPLEPVGGQPLAPAVPEVVNYRIEGGLYDRDDEFGAQTAPNLEVIEGGSNVRELPIVNEKDLLQADELDLDWEYIAPPGSFLHEWMMATTIDDLPHEFYLMLGMMALGFTAGNNNILKDFKDVKANLFVCLYGKTGLGKSRSVSPFMELMKRTMPYEEPSTSGEEPKGVKFVPTSGSGESMIDSFTYTTTDANGVKVRGGNVKGLMNHAELSGLISRASRSGSSMKEVLMELYDVYGGEVSTHSRSSGITYAHNPFAQMISTSQPNAIHAFLRSTDVESGFLNRWIFAAGRPRRDPIPYGGVTFDLNVACDKLREIQDWADQGHEFRLEGGALDAWIDFFNRQIAPYRSGQIDQESIMSRLDLTLKKFIVILTMNDMKDQPDESVVRRAISFAPYLRLTYAAFARDIAFNDITDCQNKIVAIIEKFEREKNRGPSKRELTRAGLNGFDGEMIVRALKNLSDLGMIEEVPGTGKRGPATSMFKLAF